MGGGGRFRAAAAAVALAATGPGVPAAAAAVAAASVAAASPVDLLSHRASYRLRLREPGQGSGVVAVRGGLVVEWRASCDGWISQQRLGFVAATEDGPGFSYDVRFSSWEARERTALRFAVRTYDDGELADEARGKAVLEGPGGPGEVRFSLPEGERLALPAGTIFPTEHLLALIAAGREGRRFLVHDVFDGSGADGLNRISAVVGAPAPGDGGEPLWPVSLAYYPAEGEEPTPEFQLAFKLSGAGVLHDVVLDYGEFRLAGELERLERLVPVACD